MSKTTPAPDASARGSRLLWADVAKGLTIILVVLNHLVARHFLALDLAAPGPVEEGWRVAMSVLAPIRMPLFFLLSGFFAASALRRPFAAVRGRRMLRPYYLFALWLVLHATFFSYETTLVTTRIDSAGELATQLVHPSSSLWFLHALAVHFGIAYALRAARAPLAVVAAVALAAAAAGPALGLSSPVLANLPFFLAGGIAPQVVRRMAEAATPRRLAVLLPAYGSAAVALPAWGGPAVGPLVSVLGVWLAVVAIVCASAALPRAARLVAALGGRTLPIYVLHMPVLALLHGTMATAGAPSLGWLAILYPPLVTLAVVLGCLGVHRAVSGSLPWLFDLPAVAPGVAARARQPAPALSGRALRPRFAA